MMKPNPFAVLEFTVGLVRLLKEKPTRLVRLAETHCKWLLAGVHPDRPGFGDEERSRLLTGAASDLKNERDRDAAIEEFLREGEARDLLVSELKLTREQLELAEREKAELAGERDRLNRLLDEAGESLGGRLGEWFGRTCLNHDLVEFGEKRALASLEGSLLVLGSIRPGYVDVIIVGKNRLVVFEKDIPSGGLAVFSQPVEREMSRIGMTLIGSYEGVKYGPGRTVNLKRGETPGQPGLDALGFEITPAIRLGKRLVACHSRSDGESSLWFFGALLEARPGSVEVKPPAGRSKVGRFKWNPAGEAPR